MDYQTMILEQKKKRDTELDRMFNPNSYPEHLREIVKVILNVRKKGVLADRKTFSERTPYLFLSFDTEEEMIRLISLVKSIPFKSIDDLSVLSELAQTLISN